MKLPRRNFLHLAAGAVVSPAVSRLAWAQAYPTRPVRTIVGFAPGGPNDVVARLIGQWLSERFGQQFIIENRTGAAGNLATDAVIKAPADGYTLLLINSSHAVNANLYEKIDFAHDIAPIAGLIRTPFVMEVNPSVPTKTIPDFISYAKANPGKLNFASGGNGTSVHVSGELFKMMTGTNLVHVPYRGSAPALTDMIAGQVQVMFDVLTSSLQHVRSGALRGLAVTTATRSGALPDLPTVAEFVPGYESSAWYGVGVPRNTPHEIVDKLNKEINAGLADPKLKARLVELAGAPLPGAPADFRKLVQVEIEKWGKVVKFAGIKPE